MKYSEYDIEDYIDELTDCFYNNDTNTLDEIKKAKNWIDNELNILVKNELLTGLLDEKTYMYIFNEGYQFLYNEINRYYDEIQN